MSKWSRAVRFVCNVGVHIIVIYFIYLYICVSTYLFVWLSIYLSVSIYMSIYFIIYLSIYVSLSICLSLYLSYSSVFYPPISYLHIYQHTHTHAQTVLFLIYHHSSQPQDLFLPANQPSSQTESFNFVVSIVYKGKTEMYKTTTAL